MTLLQKKYTPSPTGIMTHQPTRGDVTAPVTVLVKVNGAHESPAVAVPIDGHPSFNEWLSIASTLLDIFPPAEKAYNVFGVEIDDVLQFPKGQVVFLAMSARDKFERPQSASRSTKAGNGDGEGALPTMLGVFSVNRIIGVGALGSRLTVAQNSTTSELVVLKFIAKARLVDYEEQRKLSTMIESLTVLKGQRGVIRYQERQDTASHVVLVFEPWSGQTLRQYMAGRGREAALAKLSEDEAKRVMLKVLHPPPGPLPHPPTPLPGHLSHTHNCPLSTSSR